ncbi:MAG TPA: DoxX family protein [Planctomycetota bacterium]|nr:DoxX family protein [Planctomycetota bacterium]
MIDRVGEELKDYAPLVLRLGLAVIFIIHGAEAVPEVRSPSAAKIIVMVVELIGGLFCLIGFLTRWAAFCLGALMIWTMIDGERFRHFTDWHYQLPFALLVMSAALWGLGGGRVSLDEKQKKKDH